MGSRRVTICLFIGLHCICLLEAAKQSPCKKAIESAETQASSPAPVVELTRKLSATHKQDLEELVGHEINDGVPNKPSAQAQKNLAPVYRMLNAGPETWIDTGVKSQEAQPYQRGLTGSEDAGNYFGDGAHELYTLLSGKQDKETRSVTVFKRNSDSAELLDTVNRQYIGSSTIMIRGKADPQKMSSGLSDAHKYLATNSKESIEDIGMFFPSYGNEIEWARSYRTLIEGMTRTGFKFEPESNGAAFFSDFSKVEKTIKLKQTEFGLKIENPEEYEANLRALFNKWKSPRE